MLNNTIRVAALTGGKTTPSARFRVRQLIEPLRDKGIHMQEFIPLVNKYPPKTRWLRPAWGMAALAFRLPSVLATHRFDVTFLQRELISTFETFERLTKNPRVFDVDDAIFLYREGGFARRIAQYCDRIICGNRYLAETFSKWNKDIRIIPTGVDILRYTPLPNSACRDNLVIGWIGTSGNLKYLYEIEDALVEVFKARSDVVLRIISDAKPRFRCLTENNIEYIKWSPEIEVQSIQSMAVGIMPLIDSPWERGKCSYKMLLYMACGIPVVVSPVGMNAEVLSLGNIGVAAKEHRQWVDGIVGLLSDVVRRNDMAIQARKIIKQQFSLDKITNSLAEALKL